MSLSAGRKTPPIRNALAQYDELVDHWWRPDGEFAALHWLAAARATLIPPPARHDAVLLDVACGGGLMAGRIPAGYQHVGLDRTASALRLAASHGLTPVQGDVAALPFPDACADVVLAGEILEHVTDVETVVAELARVLRPGGTVVLDTINATRWARFSLVTVGERLPGGPPRHIHDPALFVRPERLRGLFLRHGILLVVRGLRPRGSDYLRFLLVDRARPVTMVPTRSLAGVYQGVGRKALA